MKKLKKHFVKSGHIIKAQRRASCYCNLTCSKMCGGDYSTFKGQFGSYNYISDSDYRANL